MSAPQKIAQLINRLPLRVAAVSLLILPAAIIGATLISPCFVPNFANRLAVEVSAEMGRKANSSFQILKIITQHDLAWCYVTDGSGNVMPLTRPFAPNLLKYDENSREVEVRGFHYYESVLPIDDGGVLHVGIPLHQSWETFLFNPADLVFFLLNPIKLGEAVLILLIELLTLLVVIHLSITWPLERVAKHLKSLPRGGKFRQVDTAFGATEEVNYVINAINSAFGQETIKPAKTRVEEEVKSREEKHKQEVLTAPGSESVKRTASARQNSAPVGSANSEGSGPLLRNFEHELSSAPSRKVFATQVLNGLQERFPGIISQAVFFKLDRDYHPSIDAVIGLDSTSTKLIQEVDHREVIKGHFASAKSADIGPMFIRRLGFEPLSNRNSIRRILYFIIKHGGQDLAAFIVFLSDEEQVNAEQLRSIERFRDQISSFYHKLLRIEAAEEADWTDHLTGLRNRQFLNELMVNLVERTSQGNLKSPYSVVMISGDFQDATLKLQETEVRDRWLQELAKVLRTAVDVKDRIEQSTDPAQYLVRYQGDEFAFVLEATDIIKALDFADRVRVAVQNTDQWAGGVRKITMSAGCATFGINGEDPEELIAKARTALQYVNDQLGSNKVCHASNVPQDYTPAKRGSAFSGELGVLDCSGLLQSIATSQKTGLLSVQDDTGRQLLVSFETGKPKQAKLGDLTGLHAIVEFIVTFETGTFTFKQRAKTTIDGAGSDLQCSLDKCLIEGALAEDHMRLARRVIPDMNVLVRAVPGIDTAYRWLKLQQDRDTSQDELDAMKELIKLATGNRSLGQIFAELKVPSYVLWRSAFLLVENRLLQVKKQ